MLKEKVVPIEKPGTSIVVLRLGPAAVSLNIRAQLLGWHTAGIHIDPISCANLCCCYYCITLAMESVRDEIKFRLPFINPTDKTGLRRPSATPYHTMPCHAADVCCLPCDACCLLCARRCASLSSLFDTQEKSFEEQEWWRVEHDAVPPGDGRASPAADVVGKCRASGTGEPAAL